jgi:hypothetical protein
VRGSATYSPSGSGFATSTSHLASHWQDERDAIMRNETSRTTARIVGLLFLAATASYLSGTLLIDSILDGPDSLSQVDRHSNLMVVGALLQFVDVAAVIGIVVLMYPILKRHSETVALGYVVARIFDGMGVVASGFCALTLIPLGANYVNSGAPADSYFHELGALLVAGSDTGYQIAMIALALGSIPFCYLLYRTRLIPRSISVLGLIGYAALMVSALLEVFDYSTGVVTFLYLPGALFEVVFPAWLIVKGFNPSPGGFRPPDGDVGDLTGVREPAVVPAQG